LSKVRGGEFTRAAQLTQVDADGTLIDFFGHDGQDALWLRVWKKVGRKEFEKGWRWSSPTGISRAEFTKFISNFFGLMLTD
jgi:hypothetical protein